MMYSYPVGCQIVHHNRRVFARADGFVHRLPERFALTAAGKILPEEFGAPDKLAEHGIRPWRQAPPPARGYRATGWETVDDADGAGLVKRPSEVEPVKSLAELRDQVVEEINRQAFERLKPTDWLVARKVEIGKDIPQATAQQRAAIRAAAGAAETEVAAITDYDELLAFRPTWPGGGA